VVQLGFALSEVYVCKPDGEALRLIEEFAAMVRWWAEKAKGFPGRDYTGLRKTFYAEWVQKWPTLSRQLIHTSACVAASKLKLQRSVEERPKHPDVEVSYAVLHPKMLKITRGMLRVSTAKGQYCYIQLKPKNSYQKRLIEQAEEGLWQIGQAVLTKSWVMIPFTCEELDETAFHAIEKLLAGPTVA
jgi:hypothetical protein